MKEYILQKKPLVSIVIPTFNQGEYIQATIDHCLFQSYENIEIIIIDGGSTDCTKSILSQLHSKIANEYNTPVSRLDNINSIVRSKEKRYPQDVSIKITTFDHDIGATQTYNKGFEKAKGKYCTYIVGDDIPYPDMISEMVNVLENTQYDFVYSDMNLIDDSGNIIRQMKMPEYNFERCFAQWFHIGVSHLYRTELHHTVGYMDEQYTSANDYDHYLRFAMAGAKFIHLPKVLYAVRHHGDTRKTGQHTSTRYKNLLFESKKCALRARKWLKDTRCNSEGMVAVVPCPYEWSED